MDAELVADDGTLQPLDVVVGEEDLPGSTA